MLCENEESVEVSGTTEGRWLVVATPAHLEAARRHLDPSNEFAVFTSVSLDEAERVALWLSHTADGVLEDPLARVLAVLSDRTRETPEEPWNDRDAQGRSAQGLARLDPAYAQPCSCPTVGSKVPPRRGVATTGGARSVACS